MHPRTKFRQGKQGSKINIAEKRVKSLFLDHVLKTSIEVLGKLINISIEVLNVVNPKVGSIFCDFF